MVLGRIIEQVNADCRCKNDNSAYLGVLITAPYSYMYLVSGLCLSNHLVGQGSWIRYPVWQHTFVSPSTFSRRAVISYWQKYVHEVLVNRLGDLSLPRKSVFRLTDGPYMTLDVYRGRKTTMQQ